jgi:hypothetical protein
LPENSYPCALPTDFGLFNAHVGHRLKGTDAVL